MLKFEIDEDGEFGRAINIAIKEVGDLRAPFGLIKESWFKGNMSIFPEKRGGPGKYADLSEKYKRRKEKAIGSAYPILRGFVKPKGGAARKSGRLARSMTVPNSKGAISTVTNKRTLTLGTQVKNKKGVLYPEYLHFGTSKMPARPLLLLGAEQVAPSQINKRVENWVKMISDYVIQKSPGKAT